MREVTKEEFKAVYFRRGGGTATGWSADYWNSFFGEDRYVGMKYCVQEPDSPAHTRMMIVTDFGAKEYRLFFLTEEAEERFFDFPGKS